MKEYKSNFFKQVNYVHISGTVTPSEIIYIYIYIYMYTHAHTHTHTHTHIYIYVCVCVCVYYEYEQVKFVIKWYWRDTVMDALPSNSHS